MPEILFSVPQKTEDKFYLFLKIIQLYYLFCNDKDKRLKMRLYEQIYEHFCEKRWLSS